MDPMSDVLASMHVRSFGFGRLEAGAPWGLSYLKHSAALGMLLEGECWLTMPTLAKPVRLARGDCWLTAHGDPHVLSDRPGSPARAFSEVTDIQGPTMRVGGRGAVSVIVGGWFRFDPLSSRPLTRFLPPLIHIAPANAYALGLGATLQALANETGEHAPGSKIVINRLAEILFIQMIRGFVASESNSGPGWLRALGDRQIGATLRLMHEHTERHWTVGDLAREVGLSRSAFARRFVELVGESPMEYLSYWRMYKAGELLRGSDLKLSEIAHAVGYDSEAALCHAFKRVLGVTTGQYRSFGHSSARGALRPTDISDV
jgi:AraC-like DNA-binding protein